MNLTLGYAIPNQGKQRRLGRNIGLLSFLGNWSPLRSLTNYILKSSTGDFVSIRLQMDGALQYLKTEDVVVDEVPTSLLKVCRLLNNLEKKANVVTNDSAPEIQEWRNAIRAAAHSSVELLKYVEFLYEVEKIGTQKYLESNEELHRRTRSNLKLEISEDQL